MMSLTLFHYHYFAVPNHEFGYGETTEEGNLNVRLYFIILSEFFSSKPIAVVRCINSQDVTPFWNCLIGLFDLQKQINLITWPREQRQKKNKHAHSILKY